MPASRHKAGFSLIELMIVIVILGLLAATLVPRIMDRPDDAKVTKTKTDIRALETALRFYRLDNGNYPSTEQGLEALIEEPDGSPVPANWRKGGYLEASSTPKDAWNNDFIYRSPGDDDHDYEIISLGADGEEGGEDYDADINSWELSQ